MSKMEKIDDAQIIFNQNGVIGKHQSKKDQLEYVYQSFEPGEATQSHIQDILISFFVIAGEGTVIVDEKQHQLKKRESIEIPAGCSRLCKNIGSEKLELVVVKLL